MVSLVYVTTLTGAAETPAPVTELQIVDPDTTPMLYATSPAGDVITAYRVPGSGAAQEVARIPLDPPQSADGPLALPSAGFTRAGIEYLVTLDTGANAIVLHQVVPPDGIEELARSGAADGLGIATPTHVEIVETAGQAFAIVGSAGSSSLSVLEITEDGHLLPVDHVIDDMETRFSRVTSLETVTLEGRVYVLAGGADDGISLFELLPGGRLLQLDTVADRIETGLSNVVALAAHAEGGVMQVFAGSEVEPGVTQFSVGFGPAGVVQIGGPGQDVLSGSVGADLLVGTAGADILAGGEGRDTLLDGAGMDLLSGGAGADTFVLAADGMVDEITDFDPYMDILDLSGWAMLRSTAQLEITATGDGAQIVFGDEVLILRGSAGQPIDPVLLAGQDMLNLSRVPILPTVLQALFEGSFAPDRIEGNAAANILRGQGGSDALFGFGGDDLLEGGIGADWLEGGSDDDHLIGNGGADTLLGESGDDQLDGNAGDDRISGGTGSDHLTGGQGIDLLQGDGGDDRLYGKGGTDTLEGGDGDDLLEGGDANDALWGGKGRDTLNGGQGFDRLEGEDGDDWLAGSDGYDLLRGGGGDDVLLGNAGNDVIEGGAGDDTLQGGQGIDVMRGGAGDDLVRGQTGYDDLDGGAGNDTVQGGEGNDRIAGGLDNDVLTGGTGADVFVFDAGQDWITDLSLLVDRIELDAAALAIAGLDGAAVVAGFADVTAEGTVLSFQTGDVLTLEGITNLTRLEGLIEVI